MCQLLFAKSKSSVLTKFLILEGLRQGSLSNPNGTGIYCPETGVYKVAANASDLRSFDFLSRVGKTALGHVRLASKGIEVTEENAHPFAGDRWVLAHNGTLWGAEETVAATGTVVQSRDSDSLQFLKELERVSKDSEDGVVKLLSSAMSKFKGKFAFLLYDKTSSKWYAARGKLATLYISFVYMGVPPETPAEKEAYNYNAPFGYMVMTEKATLELATERALLSTSAITAGHYWFTVGTLLPNESVFELTAAGAKKIGEIVETPAYPAAPAYENYYGRRAHEASRTGISATPYDIKDQAVEALIAEWLLYHNITLVDFELILLRVLGKPICYLAEDDLTWIVETLLPMLKPSKQKLNMFKSTVKVVDTFQYRLFKDVPNMQFPWTLAAQDVLKKALKVWRKRDAA